MDEFLVKQAGTFARSNEFPMNVQNTPSTQSVVYDLPEGTVRVTSHIPEKRDITISFKKVKVGNGQYVFKSQTEKQAMPNFKLVKRAELGNNQYDTFKFNNLPVKGRDETWECT